MINENTPSSITPNQAAFRMLASFLATLLLSAALIFGCVGRLNWTLGWLFIITWIVPKPVFLVSLRWLDPDLLVERATRYKNTQRYDRIILLIYFMFAFGTFIVASLVGGRFGWSGDVSIAWVVSAYIIYLLGNSLARLTRHFLLRAGEVTELGDGIFFLSLDEMTAVLGGDRSSAVYISERREMYNKYCALPPYPSLIIGAFDPFAWAADPNRRSDFFDARKPASKAGNIIKGFAGAAGCVEGRVRCIDRAEDGDQILPGEILVTFTTNVGWTPLFPRLAAIVTDVGAPLSHAAIVAREMGIPAVVGCGNATMILKTGDRVRVDGSAGTVKLN